MYNTSRNLWITIQDILFPPYCLFCNEDLQYNKEEILCPLCRSALNYSNTHRILHQGLINKLREHYPFEWVFCKYRFPNQSKVQILIHSFKYRNLSYIGYLEGLHYGKIIKNKLLELKVSHIVPIPIHWSKRLNRGYNQCISLSNGISDSTSIPVVSTVLYRKKRTKSQTKLKKAERIINLRNAFALHNKNRLIEEDSHFLLIDDVLTTGITVSEAAICLQTAYPNARISVCTLAYKDY